MKLHKFALPAWSPRDTVRSHSAPVVPFSGALHPWKGVSCCAPAVQAVAARKALASRRAAGCTAILRRPPVAAAGAARGPVLLQPIGALLSACARLFAVPRKERELLDGQESVTSRACQVTLMEGQ